MVTTSADGTKIEKEIITSADGTKIEKQSTTDPVGNKTTSTAITNKDGSTEKKVEIANVDGTTEKTVEDVKPDGTTFTTSDIKKSNGYTVHEERATKPSGDYTSIKETTSKTKRTILAEEKVGNTKQVETYNVTGYVTETDGVVSKGQQIFWMADAENGGKIFQSYWCNVPEQIKVGDYVSVKGNILRYNSTYEIKHGDVLLLERKSTEAIEDIGMDNTPTKILRNGQIYILRGDKTYTLQGQEMK